jgi:hypothetical protein
MKSLLITLIALSSCAPVKKIHQTFVNPKSETSEVTDTVKKQEGFTHLSKETPVWQIFTIIVLGIVVSCALSRNWKKSKSKKPFSSSGPDIT